VDDPLLVCRFEGFCNLLRDRHCLIDGHGALRNAVGECRTFDEFHHERDRAGRSLKAVDRRDVRVVQCRKNFRFALEPRESLCIASD